MSSAYVSSLRTVKPLSRTCSATSSHTRRPSSEIQHTNSTRSKLQISPPLTPRVSHEALPVRLEREATFHNYLRAFYHFHPASTASSSTHESSVILPLNQGDVILIHSIHPNGWADGTLLSSGSRGWLPTNYCEAYDHDSIRNLLNALTNLWDLVGSGEPEALMVFVREDYVRGIIAGVRYLLVSSCDDDCLLVFMGFEQMTFIPLLIRYCLTGKIKVLEQRIANDTNPCWSSSFAQRTAQRPFVTCQDLKAATRNTTKPGPGWTNLRTIG